MAITRTGKIGTEGKVYQGGGNSWMNLRITMEAQEYPTKITITGMDDGHGWENITDSAIHPIIYLCDNATGGSRHMLLDAWMSAWEKPRGSAWRIFDLSGANTKNLKGKTLAIRIMNGYASNFAVFRNAATVKVVTNYDEYTITIAETSHGTVTPNVTKAMPGDTVTLNVSPDEGCYLQGYETEPAGLDITNNQFTMPESDVNIEPVFAQVEYSISFSAEPQEAAVISGQGMAHFGDAVQLTRAENPAYQFIGWETNPAITVTNNTFVMPAANITLVARYEPRTYQITKLVLPAGAGDIVAPASMKYGESTGVSQTPATGYTFAGWNLAGSEGATIENGVLTMGRGNLTLMAAYDLIRSNITKAVNPEGAGTVSCAETAEYGSTVSVSQTPAEGYYFDGWTLSDGGLVENDGFTMPAYDVTLTANYLKRSTATFSETVTGGRASEATVTSEDGRYEHVITLDFPGKIQTPLTVYVAGLTTAGRRTFTVSMNVPIEWSAGETSAAVMTGGVLTVKTYNGRTLIGTYTITGISYIIPASAGPVITGSQVQRICAVDGKTYADVGAYVQNHSGVSAAVTAAGQYGASISSIRVWVYGYEGGSYDRTVTGSSGSLSSGILSRAGENRILATVTDSRGMSITTEIGNITVEAYVAPAILLFECWRTDAAGNPDTTGERAQYNSSIFWTQVGSNAVVRKIEVYGTEETISADTGWILPTARQTFPATQTAAIAFTVGDAFESTSVTIRLDTRSFIMHFSATGTSAAFGHACQETPTGNNPSGNAYTGTFEIDESMQVWVGLMTLKDYIRGVVAGMI